MSKKESPNKIVITEKEKNTFVGLAIISTIIAFLKGIIVGLFFSRKK